MGSGKRQSSDTGLAILGCGNIGSAIARGLAGSGQYQPELIILTRRQIQQIDDLAAQGFLVQTDNSDAVRRARTIIISVLPQQMVEVLSEIGPEVGKDQVIISTVSGVSCEEITDHLGQNVSVVRAMPNTAAEIGESITCLAAQPGNNEALQKAAFIFSAVGETMEIAEELMVPATALGACGVAFFLRCIRAASQGGIEIGFHPAEALQIAAQTARGAASLVLKSGNHPEAAIDMVTSPRGATISGLNHMEHEGLSSALIKGIVTSAEKVAQLFQEGGK
jgi:pyrroline-5-carboxylate reductase